MDISFTARITPDPHKYGKLKASFNNHSDLPSIKPKNKGQKTVTVELVMPENVTLEHSLDEILAHVKGLLVNADNKYNFIV